MDYSGQLLASPYWSTIIAITAAEESYSKRPANSPQNLWGIMYPKCCILKKFKDFPEAIDYMNDYLAKTEVNHPTIESLNGWYVYPWSANWQNTVIKTKNELESL